VARRALRTATRVGQSIGAGVMGSRQLESWETAPLIVIGAVLLASAVIGLWRPHFLAWPLAALAIWFGLSFIAQAMGLFRGRNLP
jgi:cardiolipin synthase